MVPDPSPQPSAYELEAWQHIGQYEHRPASWFGAAAGERVADGIAEAGHRAQQHLADHPRVEQAFSRGQRIVAQGASAAGAAAHWATGALPKWPGQALASLRQTVGKMSRVGLSPQKVVRKHQQRGHGIARLADLRRLDLADIDEVRGHAHEWYYPALAALSGAGAGLVITGGELVIVAGAGATAAPEAGAIAGAFAADASFVLGLASRCAGQVALDYGYDPEEPVEKLFIMAIVNVATAASSSAKTAALSDISRLTQALARQASLDVVNESVVARVANQFGKLFGVKMTRRALGSIVPVAGILLGGTFNWAMLESIVDAANIAYRRRFLLEKYPQLEDDGPGQPAGGLVSPQADEGEPIISLLDELARAGGPDLRADAQIRPL